MTQLRVNPTRMEMKRLKTRLKTAQRGHKLLKDKTDEMVRQFIQLAKINKKMRDCVELDLTQALQTFLLTKALTPAQVVEEAVLMPARHVTLTCAQKSLMGVLVPTLQMQEEAGELFPYSFLSVTSELDDSLSKLNGLLVPMLQLAEVEKSCNMLAVEIEKNKRRVNALENVMIPQMQETIRMIKMKLDESERGALVRLMKVKAMIAERQDD